MSDPWEAIEECYRSGWSDGLPVVPATEELVNACLRAGHWEPDQVLLHEPVRRRGVPAYKVAINAVMAGCLPAYMPVLGAALEAMGDDDYRLHGPLTSTGGAAPLIIVNGPIRRQVAINCEGNLFGPGSRANATIGRAIRLIYLNCLSAKPGVLDRSTQGWPGKYTACFGEFEEVSPWPPFHVDRGYAPTESTVTVFAAEAPHNIQNHLSPDAEGILTTIADAMAALGSFSPGQSVVVLCPEHVEFLRRDGWTKSQVQEYLFEHARRTVADLKRGGKRAGSIVPEDRDQWEHRGESPQDIAVFVGGGLAGGHSAFFPSWGRRRGSLMVTKPIRV